MIATFRRYVCDVCGAVVEGAPEPRHGHMPPLDMPAGSRRRWHPTRHVDLWFCEACVYRAGVAQYEADGKTAQNARSAVVRPYYDESARVAAKAYADHPDPRDPLAQFYKDTP